MRDLKHEVREFVFMAELALIPVTPTALSYIIEPSDHNDQNNQRPKPPRPLAGLASPPSQQAVRSDQQAGEWLGAIR